MRDHVEWLVRQICNEFQNRIELRPPQTLAEDRLLQPKTKDYKACPVT